MNLSLFPSIKKSNQVSTFSFIKYFLMFGALSLQCLLGSSMSLSGNGIKWDGIMELFSILA